MSSITVFLSQDGEEHRLADLTAKQVEGMEGAVAALLCEHIGPLVPCGRLQWFQVGGSVVRPSMTIREHHDDLGRVLWATRSGRLYDLVVHKAVAREVSRVMHQWATPPAADRTSAGEQMTAAEMWSPTRLIAATLS
ncbi:MAG: hypothetical protein ABFE08_15685 [Armatimonadia bacterium]